MTAPAAVKPVERPRGDWVFRRWGLSARVPPRPVWVGVVLAVVVVALAVYSLTAAGAAVSTDGAFRALFGRADPLTTFLVRDIRLPRVLTAVLVGACLGVAGMVFQNLGRNPLASPDLIGFSAGASMGAIGMIVVFGAGVAAVSAGAALGGLAVGVAVYVLAWRGGLHGSRMLVIGLALAAMAQAGTSYLLSRASITDASGAAEWLVGTLSNRTWDHVVPVAVAAGALLPVLVVIVPGLRALELGDDSARSLGVRTETVRALALLAGVGLTAGSVAAAGPIPFVALAAPQIAKRLTRGSGTALWAPALCGAVLLLASDILTQRLFSGEKLPVGVVTAVLGGTYLTAFLKWGRRSP